jgi:hypothetical protein
MARHSDSTLIQFLLTMAFVTVVAIFNWIKRRSQSEEPAETGSEQRLPPTTRAPSQRTPASPAPQPIPSARTPAPSAPRPAPRKIDWQEELRRMLEGDEQAAPTPRSAPTPHTAAPPPLVVAPPALPASRPVPARPISPEQERGLPVQLRGLTTSIQTYQRASQLDQNVADHLLQVTERVRRHQPTRQGSLASQDIAHTLALLRTQPGLRSVIMASIVLGPPKALEA